MIPVIETATARYRTVLLANVHAAQQPALGDPAVFAAPSLGQVEGLVANYRAALFAKHGTPLRKADDAVDEWLEPDLAMADAYIGEVRAEIIDPFIEAAETALEVGGTAALINLVIGRPAQGLGPGVWWVIEDSARDHFVALAAWQRIETLRFFEAAIGYSVESVLVESRIAVSLEARILENVSRISSIPADMHNDLARRLFGVMQTHGADYDRFKEVLAKQYDVTGYRLERLAQDQTAKAFAVQNELYQRMAGIAEYRWSYVSRRPGEADASGARGNGLQVEQCAAGHGASGQRDIMSVCGDPDHPGGRHPCTGGFHAVLIRPATDVGKRYDYAGGAVRGRSLLVHPGRAL